MNTRTCRAPGCDKHARGFSNLCGQHLRNKQRHGHEGQQPLQRGEINRVKRHVTSLIDGRENAAEVWAKLAASVEALKAEASARARSGRAGFRWLREGEADIEAACLADAEAVLLTGLAIAYLVAAEPKRFLSDRAMFFAAGRQIRLINPENFRTTINPKTGKRHRTPRDTRPARLLHIGERLLATLGGPGLALRSAEVATERKRQEARTEATRAITFTEVQHA